LERLAAFFSTSALLLFFRVTNDGAWAQIEVLFGQTADLLAGDLSDVEGLPRGRLTKLRLPSNPKIQRANACGPGFGVGAFPGGLAAG